MNEIGIDTNIKVVLPHISVKMKEVVQGCSDQLDEIIEKAIKNFDFETTLTKHIYSKINEGIDGAMDEICLKDDMKAKLWERINKSLAAIKL